MSGSAHQAQEQRVFGLKQMTKDERHQLLFSAKISHAISQEDTLAMALHFQLSGEQQRKLRLWTKQWHVQLACERQVRCLAAKRLEDIEIGQEAIQTIDQEADDCTVHLKPSPFVWVKDIIALVAQHLDGLQRSNQLTWHEREDGTSLPCNEIWLKVGGDKGGGNFKICFQVVNRAHPNSPDHTTVFACLEADDSLANRHLVLDQYRQDISELQGMTWR